MQAIIDLWRSIGQFQVLENELQNVVIAGIVLFLGLIFKALVSNRISFWSFRLLRSTFPEVPVQKFVQMLRKPVELFFVLTIVYTAFSFLHYPDSWGLAPIKKFGLKMVVARSYGILIFFSLGWILFRLVDFVAEVLKDRSVANSSKVQEQLVPFIRQLTKMVISIILLFVILGVVFHMNVGAVITGLGIGGVAVALAGKETLENLLASFSIFIDKPFVAGDLIKVQGYVGNVETVGFRTTRIRTLDKSLLSIPNKQLIDQPLENLTSRKYHRANFKVGVPFGTTEKTLRVIIQRIQDEIHSNPLTDAEHKPIVFFDGFAAYSLEITVIFYARTQDFEDYWKIKENINFRIMKIMDELHVDFEYPTQIVRVLHDESLQTKGFTDLSKKA